MIKSLALTNFQSHKSTLITLDPGVNVIIGKSDSGKSSILRIIEWIVKNRPTGESFRSNWGGSTHGTMVTDQDNIVRMRNNTENGYRLNTQTHFKAIKTDVPEEIQKALNFSEVNLQGQFDQPFLITATPGDVAKHFNHVAKLDKIDSGVKNINSDIRQIDQNIKAYDMNVESSEKKLEDYAHLEKFEIEVEALEQLRSQYLLATNNQTALFSQINALGDLKEEIEEASEIMKDEELVNNTLDLIYKRDALEDGPISDIKELIQAIEIHDKELHYLNYALKEWEKRFKEEFPEICPLCSDKALTEYISKQMKK